jgi:hypothetical protein
MAQILKDLTLPGFDIKLYRSGDLSGKNRIGFIAQKAKSLTVFMAIEGTGPYAEEAPTAVNNMLAAALPSIADKWGKYPSLLPWAIIQMADLAVKEARPHLKPPHLSAKMSLVVATDNTIYSAQAGDCGGVAVWTADDQDGGQFVRRLCDPAVRAISLPQDYGDTFDTVIKYPIGMYEITDQSQNQNDAGVNPLKAAGDWFVLTSVDFPRAAIEPFFKLHKRGTNVMMSHIGEILEVPAGLDFVAALVSLKQQ